MPVRVSSVNVLGGQEQFELWPGVLESIWVTPGQESVLREQPTVVPCTSFNTAVRQVEDFRAQAERFSPAECAPQEAILGEPERLAQQLMPPGALPDAALPRQIVHRFTKATACWWWLAALVHVVKTLHFGTLLAVDGEEVSPWKGGAFFEVASLDCNSTHLLLSDRFMLYSANRRTLGLGELGDAASSEAGTAAKLAWLRGFDTRHPPPAQLPESWRVTAVAWQPCEAAANATCEDAWLAGWDGESVNVATATFDVVAGAWHVRPRFRVNHQLGRHASWFGWREVAYDNIVALDLEPHARTLTVLLDDRNVDVWDLSAGAHLGRWALPDKYTAVCSDGADLLLVRQTADRPVLERARLPDMAQRRARLPEAVPREPSPRLPETPSRAPGRQVGFLLEV